MCGIIGVIGNGRAAPTLLTGLQKLDYRGYDSAGMAAISDGKIWLKKDVGKLSEVEEKHHLSHLPGEVGIGHVRWATTGAVTQVNSHPHLDCKGEVAVVHNGIIENYQEIRERLKLKHKFVSETDTEVLPHLIEEYMNSGVSLEKAVFQSTKELRGSYAFLAIASREPKKIVAACRDEPLVIGLGNNGCNFITSDPLSFLEETNKAIHLDSGETATLTEDKITLFDSQGKEIRKEPEEIQWRCDEATKQGYDFFTLKEIMEQPQAIRRALMQDKNLVMGIAMDILKSRDAIFTACGSSRYAALLGRYIFSKLGRKFTDVVMASEFQYFSDSINRDTLVMAVSQSGETADVLAGAKAAKKNGASIVSVVNRVGSLLARMSDKVIYLNCGPEIGVAATKSFTSQLVIFYLLSSAMANKLDEGLDKIKTVSLLMEENLHENGEKLVPIAQKISSKEHCYYIGRGGNLHIAAEGALKLKEISYIHADGMPAGELKHGTLALIEKGTPVVGICPQDYTFYDTMSNIEEAKARGAFIIGVSDRRQDIFDEWVQIPQVEELLYPLVTVAPLQLLAYHTAIARGLDPDKPRNLAKSVTVK